MPSHIAPAPHALNEFVRTTPVAAVIAHAIQKNVEQRYSSAREMLAELRRAVPELASSKRNLTTEELPIVGDPLESTERMRAGRLAKTDAMQQSVEEPSPHSSTVVIGVNDLGAQQQKLENLIALRRSGS